MAVELNLKIGQDVYLGKKKAKVVQIVKHLSPVAYGMSGLPPKDEEQQPEHIKSVSVLVQVEGEDFQRRVDSQEITA